MIKYLGSKRALAPLIGAIASGVQARSAVDLFTGTTRVAQELKRRGLHVTANDIATYSQVLADCYIATDAASIDRDTLSTTLAELDATPGRRGYVTRTFCEEARFFQPANGMRIDAIRDRIEQEYRGSALYPVLLTSLMEAADRVDSTTGLHMAYLKRWAPRSHNRLRLRTPVLIAGPGATLGADARAAVNLLAHTDLMYLDPPYNQHRYFTNYHIWETLIRWDAPEHYGVACKRVDAREESTKSVFNKKSQMPAALFEVLARADAEVLLVSYNDESWITPEEMVRALRDTGRQDVRLLAFDSKRYVGAQIGIYNPSGQPVGQVRRLRNTEYLFLAGPRERTEAGAAAALALGGHLHTITSQDR